MLAVLREFGSSIANALGESRSWSSETDILSGNIDWWGGKTSDSGLKVNRISAMSFPAFWRCVTLIVYGCTKADLRIYKRVGEHGKERAKEHESYRLVYSQPNEMMNALTFWRTLIGHFVVGGNGYAYIERDRAGRQLGYLPLDPSMTYAARKDGVVKYVTTYQYQGAPFTRVIEASDMLHFHPFGWDGLSGYSVIDILCDAIGGALATRKHSTTVFKRGAMISGVLETANPIDEATANKTLAHWERTYTGPDNAHKVAMLTQGLKFNPIALDARKSQLLESLKYHDIQMAVIYGAPPHKTGNMERSAYNSLEMEEKSVASDALDPHWRTIEAECNTKLLSKDERENDTHFFEFNRRAAIQTDTEKESQVLEREVNAGLMMPDEARGILNMPELPFGLGKVILRPNANHTVIDLTKPPPEADNGDLDFQREYVKSLVADGTISDVMFNLTDAQALLEAVNIPVFKGYDEPWLPVIADNGELVSGETIKDSEGDVVGGDTIKAPEPEPTETDPDPVRAFAKRTRRGYRDQVLAAREAMTNALRWMTKRIAYRPGVYTGNFVENVNNLESLHRADFDRVTGPPARMIAALGGDAGPVRDLYFKGIREAMLLAAECKASELPKRVAWAMELCGRSCVKLATMAALSGVKR